MNFGALKFDYMRVTNERCVVIVIIEDEIFMVLHARSLDSSCRFFV